MRSAFVGKLMELAKINEKIILLVGDIGFGVFENFKKEFPKRYLNLGIAEQNSIGVVSGLAKEGFFPIYYTIIPFLLYRPFEQIRNDLCINRRDCLLVGVGSGLSYGALGPTHHALEDIGLMSTLPEISIYTPSSPNMVTASLEKSIKNNSGPGYLRLGKNGENNLNIDSLLGNVWSPIRIENPNQDIYIVTHGPISKNVETAINNIDYSNLVSFCVIEQIKPFPQKNLIELANFASLIITVEENYENGGIYQEVLKTMTSVNYSGKIIGISIPHRFISEVGTREHLLGLLGMDVIGLELRFREIIDREIS